MVIGITFGVYDLFHVGHVNLLKNARQQCDYLIVGLSSSDRCMAYKNKRPIISDQDRMNILKSCRYVDEVFLNNGSPDDFNTYLDNIKQYKATKWFVGSDWQNTEKFNKLQSLLQNCELIYLPHTNSISTTDIIKRIQECKNL